MSKLAEIQYENYLRMDRMPTLWCAGCGDGIIMKSLIRALDALQLDRDNTAVVSGIGCSGRMSGYLDFNTMHTTHGRALAFATGLKMVNPKAKIVVITGDGDCLAIGGNHFIHAARRNLDLTVIIVNNYTYGLTGGQVSPSSPHGSSSPTAPYGNVDPIFDAGKLSIAAGATFFGRGTVGTPLQMDKVIKAGIEHNGFSVVEILSNCHINWGRKNEHPDPHELIEWMKSRTTMNEEKAEKEGLQLLGVLHQDKEREEYSGSYYTHVVNVAQERAAKKKAS